MKNSLQQRCGMECNRKFSSDGISRRWSLKYTSQWSSQEKDDIERSYIPTGTPEDHKDRQALAACTNHWEREFGAWNVVEISGIWAINSAVVLVSDRGSRKVLDTILLGILNLFRQIQIRNARRENTQNVQLYGSFWFRT